MPTPKTTLITKNCTVCQSPFDVCPPGKTSRYCTTPFEALYCSRECRHKARVREGAHANSITDTEAAYIAGFLDGEGSIILYKRRDAFAMRVSFSNTKPAVLQWIRERVGVGNQVATQSRNPQKPHAIAYLLFINAIAACELLERVLPYLIIKQEQAELAIDFSHRLQTPALKADRTWQAAYKERMGKLNRRGVNSPMLESTNT